MDDDVTVVAMEMVLLAVVILVMVMVVVLVVVEARMIEQLIVGYFSAAFASQTSIWIHGCVCNCFCCGLVVVMLVMVMVVMLVVVEARMKEQLTAVFICFPSPTDMDKDGGLVSGVTIAVVVVAAMSYHPCLLRGDGDGGDDGGGGHLI